MATEPSALLVGFELDRYQRGNAASVAITLRVMNSSRPRNRMLVWKRLSVHHAERDGH